MPPCRRQQQQPRHQQRRSNQQQPTDTGIDAFALAFLADNVPGPEPPPQPLQDCPTPLPLPENQAPNAHPSPPQQVASPCQQQPNQQATREPRRELTLHDRYHPSLREFMRWHDGVNPFLHLPPISIFWRDAKNCHHTFSTTNKTEC